VRIIIDQQLPPLLVSWFRSRGLAAVHVRDLGMSAAPDAEIWAEATRDDAVVISRDEDFVARVRSGGARLVWVRLGNCANPALLSAIETSWAAITRRLEDGERLVELRG
jgi:predicted nuclease of predicted toxin-antitoxin system